MQSGKKCEEKADDFCRQIVFSSRALCRHLLLLPIEIEESYTKLCKDRSKVCRNSRRHIFFFPFDPWRISLTTHFLYEIHHFLVGFVFAGCVFRAFSDCRLRLGHQLESERERKGDKCRSRFVISGLGRHTQFP